MPATLPAHASKPAASVIKPKNGFASQALSRNKLVFAPDLVIPGREAQVPRVGDMIWSVYSVTSTSNKDGSQYLLQFENIVDPHQRELIRECVYFSINVDPKGEVDDATVASMEKLSGVSAIQCARDLRNFLEAVQLSGRLLHQVDQDWLDVWLSNQEVSASRKVVLVTTVRRLYIYRNRVGYYTFDYCPWGTRSANRTAGAKWHKRENTTPRIPEHVMAPTMRWALFYVEHAIDELIAHRRVHDRDFRDGRSASFAGGSVEECLQTYVAKLRREKRGLPVNADGSLSLYNVKQAAGLLSSQHSETVRASPLLKQAFDELGGNLFVGKILAGTDTPWIAGIGKQETRWEITHGLTACYLVSAAYSGARDSEVTDWRRGCLERVLARDSSVYRYKVRGRILKSEGPMGKAHTWIVIEPAAAALEAAERIQDYLAESAHTQQKSKGDREVGDYLFASVRICKESRSSDFLGTGVGISAFGKRLRVFERHCHALAVAAAERADGEVRERLLATYGIPGADGTMKGKPWPWNTRQLRRTLAWHIANQPFGVVGGKIQYGHASALMFEGYAGDSRSGFRAEIEQEREIGRMKDIVADYEGWEQGHSPAGPKGARLAESFEAIRDALGDLPGVVADVERRNKMLKNLAANVYPGYINDCHFYKGHALCLARRPKVDGGPEANGPFWAKCAPMQCPNSSITRRHLPALEASKGDTEAMLKISGQSPLQHMALQNAITQVDGLIAEVGS